MDGQLDHQDSQITSSEDTVRPQVLRSNVAERSNLQSFLEKMNSSKLLKLPGEVEKNSRIIKSFPWLKSFHILCRSAIGNRNSQLLHDLMNTYMENVSRDVINCYMKPLKAGKLKKSLNETLVFFHTYYSNLEKPTERNRYLDIMSDLVAMYMDMEIKASRRSKESVKKVSSKIISALYILLDSSLDHIFESIMKSKFFTHSFKEICIPILKRVVLNPPLPDINEMTYVSRILIFKLWKRLAAGVEDRKYINKTVSSLMPPSNLTDMLKCGLLANVIPPIPRNMKGTSISHFLLMTKLNLKDAFKAFVKMSKDSKQNDLAEVFDKSRFFRDCQIDEEPSTVKDIEDGSLALIDSIWKTISNSEPEVTSCVSLFSVFNSGESEISLIESKKSKTSKKKKTKCKKKKGKVFREKAIKTKSKFKRKSTNIQPKKKNGEKIFPKEFEEMLKKLKMLKKLETANVKNSYNKNEENHDQCVKKPDGRPEIDVITNKFSTTAEHNAPSFSVNAIIENKTELKDNKIKSEFEEFPMTSCNETIVVGNDSLKVLDEEKENINKNVLYKNPVEVVTLGNPTNNCNIINNNCKMWDESKDCSVIPNDYNECKIKDELVKNNNDCSVESIDNMERNIENSSAIKTSSETAENVEKILDNNIFHYKSFIETDKVKTVIGDNCRSSNENLSSKLEDVSPKIIPSLVDEFKHMEEVYNQLENSSSGKEYKKVEDNIPIEKVVCKTEDCSSEVNFVEIEGLDNNIESNSYTAIVEMENCSIGNGTEFKNETENNYSTKTENHNILKRDILVISSEQNAEKDDSIIMVEKLGSAVKACKITNINNFGLMNDLIEPDECNAIEDGRPLYVNNKLGEDTSDNLIEISIPEDMICFKNYNTDTPVEDKTDYTSPKKTSDCIFTTEIFGKDDNADNSCNIDTNSEIIRVQIPEKIALTNTLKTKFPDSKKHDSNVTLDCTDSTKMSEAKDKKSTSSKSKNNKNKHSNSISVNSSEFKNSSKSQNSSSHKTNSKSTNSYGRSSKNVKYICTKEPNTSDSLRLKFQRCDVKSTQSLLKHNQLSKNDIQSKTKNHKSSNEDLKQGNDSRAELQNQNCVNPKTELVNKQLIPTSVASPVSNKIEKIDPPDKSIKVTHNPDYMDISGKVFVQSSNKNGVTKLVQLPVKNAVYINIENDEKLRKQVQIKLHKLQDGVDNGCKVEDVTTESKYASESSQNLSSLVNSMDLSSSSVDFFLSNQQENSLVKQEIDSKCKKNYCNDYNNRVNDKVQNVEQVNRSKVGVIDNNFPVNNYKSRSEHGNKLENIPNNFHCVGNSFPDNSLENTLHVNLKNKPVLPKPLDVVQELNTYEDNFEVSSPPLNHLQSTVPNIQHMPNIFPPQNKPQSILKVKNFESMSQNKSDSNKFEIKKSIDTNFISTCSNKIKELQNNSHPGFNSTKTIVRNSSNSLISNQKEFDLNSKNCDFTSRKTYLSSDRSCVSESIFKPNISEPCEEYAALKNHIYSDKLYLPPKAESLKEFGLNTRDINYYGPNHLNLATNGMHSSLEFDMTTVKDNNVSTKEINSFPNELYPQPENLNVLNNKSECCKQNGNTDCGFNVFTNQPRQFVSKENRGYSFSENEVKIPNESTFNNNSLKDEIPYIQSNAIDSYSECILRSPHTEPSEVDLSALCLVVDKNIHKEDDFEMNMFPVAQEIEVCSDPSFSSWGYNPFPETQDVERRDDWCNLEENIIVDTSQKYSQGLFPTKANNDVYFSPSSAKTVDNNLKRKHMDIKRLLAEVSNIECISTDLTLEGSLDPEKLNSHKETVVNDFDMCSSQHKFKDYCLTHQDMTHSVPGPSPLENFQTFVRCPCAQCCDNHRLLFKNNNILTQYKNAKNSISLDLMSHADENSQALDKDHNVELDCSLPLKKRKTLTHPLKAEENEVISYPNTPMISIAELELTNFKPTARSILPNPQSQVLQNSANEHPLQQRRIIQNPQPQVLRNSVNELSLHPRGIRPNHRPQVLQNSANEHSLQQRRIIPNHQPQVLRNSVNELSLHPRGIRPNHRPQVLQNSANEHSLQQRRIIQNPQPQVLRNSVNELSLHPRGIRPNHRPQVLRNSVNELSSQPKSIIPNHQPQVLQHSVNELSLQSDKPGWRFKTPAQLKEHPAPTSDVTLAAHTLINFAHGNLRQYTGEEESHPVRKQTKNQNQSMSMSKNKDLSRFSG